MLEVQLGWEWLFLIVGLLQKFYGKKYFVNFTYFAETRSHVRTICYLQKISSLLLNYSFGAKEMLTRICYNPTSPATARAIGGTDVRATMIAPKRPIDKLESAAALGSVTSSRAVARAEELPPNVTPLVT